MKNGLKILFNTYRNSNGWKDGKITKEALNLAKEEGYMFDYPKVISHDETLKELEETINKIDPRDLANAFLYSLTTRKLEYRSALGSYWYAVSIPKHRLNQKDETYCNFCGFIKWKNCPNDYDLNHGINVYNFERYKFGGVRHTQLNYALFDLKQFLKLPKVKPTKVDKQILKKILECIEALEPNQKVGKLRDIIISRKILNTNKDEISILLEILGICGVLSSNEYPCYEVKFVSINERDPVEHKNDFTYPVNRWYAKDRINEERFEKVFYFNITDINR